MLASRLPLALVTAAAIHAAFLFVRPHEARRVAPLDTAIELDSAWSGPESPASPEPAPPQVLAMRPAAPRVENARIAPARVMNAPRDVGEAPAEPIAIPVGSALNAASPINLGINDYWKSVASAAPMASERASNSVVRPGSQVEQSVRDALSAGDFNRGLGAGGPVVTAAHEAASSAIAPETGTASFDIESDASGQVRSVSVASFKGGDARRWTDVANALFTLLTPKKLRVTPGGSGLRVRLHVSIDRALPGGEKATTSLGAVPDDVPGSDPVCVGVGLERKCLKGLPIGVTLNSADIHNVGAKAGRIVRARILAEQRL